MQFAAASCLLPTAYCLLRKHLPQLGLVGLGDHDRAPQPTLALARLARQDVPLERLAPDELTRSRLLEALRGATVTLQLRHIIPLTTLGGAPLSFPTSLRARGAAPRRFPPALACGRRRYPSVTSAFGLATGFLAPAFCDRIVCIWLPSCRGMFSGTATSVRSSINRSRIRRPISGCAISRPRKKIVAFTLSPSARKRSMCFFLNW